MIAPPFTALHAVRDALEGSRILLGAQNACAELEGAHTGEVSLRMLRDAGVSVVILGHSERRHVYGETDALVNRKVKLALAEGFEVILCVGETLDERQSGVTEKVVETQTRGGLAWRSRSVDARPGHDRLRAGLGHRHGQERHAAGRGRGAPFTPQRRSRGCTARAAGRAIVIQYGGLGEARERPRSDEDGEHRRRARRGGLAEGRDVRAHRAVRSIADVTSRRIAVHAGSSGRGRYGSHRNHSPRDHS